jgi:hypothetical protein
LSQGNLLVLTCSLEAKIKQFLSGGFYGKNLEMPLYQALFHTYFSTLVINTTVSTCNERGGLMSMRHFSLMLIFPIIKQKALSYKDLVNLAILISIE